MDALDVCRSLADEVNRSIKESYDSDNAVEKRDKFFLAHKRFNELKIAVQKIPGGYITGLDKFELTLEKVEDEYYEKGIFSKDIFSGWVYQAEFKLETPLSALLNHGEFRESIDNSDAVTESQEHGGWVRKTRSFREMGLDADDNVNHTIASIVGLVPRNGGIFLNYLIELRELVESGMALTDMKEKLSEVLAKQEYYEFNKKLGGKESVIKKLMKSVNL